MCAICGIVRFDDSPVDAALLTAMRDVMAHRGPDHAGLWVNGHAGLGHRRLAVIDLSERGHQPMTDERETIAVTFNGEIYNFIELRRLLELRGYVFRSRSDTEVIVHGYDAWGDEVVPRLDGMFALAIYDRRPGRDRLLVAVDRFGKKPLYIWRSGTTVRFASDTKAFWSLPGAALTVDHAAVDCYLHHLAVTNEHSIYREVETLRPAHYATFERRGAEVRRHDTRYWTPNFRDKITVSEGEALERIDVALREAVRKRLIADVPLGAFLSGGVDSSLVVAMMSQLSSGPVNTFSVDFAEQDFSEQQYASQVARRYGTTHQAIRVESDVLRTLPSLVWECGQPFADSSAVPTYYVSKAAKDFVTVALTGDGGDEQFGGYDIARASFYAALYDRLIPAGPRRGLERWLFARERTGPAQKLKTLATHASRDPARRFGKSMAFNRQQREALYTDGFRASLGAHQPWHIYDRHLAEMAALDLIDQNLYHVLMTRLPNDYLVKVDVMSMKVALELRSPFLDADLCALASSLDPRLKVKGGVQKYLTKKLAERYLPREVIYRPKQGFALPIKHWLRRDFAPVLARLLPDGNLVRAGWFRGAEIERLIGEHAAGTAEHTHRLWALLWLEIWHRIFVERSMTGEEDLRQ